uniref:Uncharacterized protein n=1 Tax=Arundo donax TaxID=35708 RepID=A0A0A9GCB4_ARUDO
MQVTIAISGIGILDNISCLRQHFFISRNSRGLLIYIPAGRFTSFYIFLCHIMLQYLPSIVCSTLLRCPCLRF